MSYVLVVDDDRDIVAMLVGLLEVHGYRARTATGADVPAICREEVPALILLDLLMPPPDGWAVYGALRAEPATRGVPVVILTALGRTAALAPDMAGAVRLDKPFGIDDLLAIVRTHAGPPGGEEEHGD